jgi:hypothetical protein
MATPQETKIEDFIRRPILASTETVERNKQAFRAARAAQRVRIAVAPGVSLEVVRASKPIKLNAADEVLPGDFVGPNTVASCLQRLVNRDAVIELNDEELSSRNTPKNARYVVAAGGSVVALRGVIHEGGKVTAADFDGKQVAIDDLVRRGAIVDRGERPEPPEAA